MKLDNIDATILSELTINACASQVELAERVASSTAIARRRRCWRKKVSSVAIRPSGSGALRSLHHRSGQGHPGKSNEEALKSFEAAVIDCHRWFDAPDVGKRRLHRHCPGAISRTSTHSQNRTLAIAAGGADSIELRHARGREPGGPAVIFW